jgi:hypothetical protein
MLKYVKCLLFVSLANVQAYYYKQELCHEFMTRYLPDPNFPHATDSMDPQGQNVVYQAMVQGGHHAKMRRCIGMMPNDPDGLDNKGDVAKWYKAMHVGGSAGDGVNIPRYSTTERCCVVSYPTGWFKGKVLGSNKNDSHYDVNLTMLLDNTKVGCSHYKKKISIVHDYRQNVWPHASPPGELNNIVNWQVNSSVEYPRSSIDSLSGIDHTGKSGFAPNNPGLAKKEEDLKELLRTKFYIDYDAQDTEQIFSKRYKCNDVDVRPEANFAPALITLHTHTVTCTSVNMRLHDPCTNSSDPNEYPPVRTPGDATETVGGFELDNPGDWITLVSTLALSVYVVVDMLKNDEKSRVV